MSSSSFTLIHVETTDEEYDWDIEAQQPTFDQLFRIYQRLRGEGTVLGAELEEVQGSSLYAPSAKFQIERQFRTRELQGISDGKNLFLRKFGFHENSFNPQMLDGPLDELRASNVSSGYFQLVFTDIPADHLQFNDFKGHPQIMILKLSHALQLYASQRIGLTMYSPDDNLH